MKVSIVTQSGLIKWCQKKKEEINIFLFFTSHHFHDELVNLPGSGGVATTTAFLLSVAAGFFFDIFHEEATSP